MTSEDVPKMFGNPADFAIEAGVEPQLVPPSSVWGHMRVWCHGVPLGDIDDRYCGLAHSYMELHWMSNHLDELWEKELAGLNDLDAWNFLDALLYGYHGDVRIEDGRTLEEVCRDARRYGKFNFLTNWGEQFDGGFKSFLLCPPHRPIRVLSRAFPESIGLGVDVSRTGFVEAVHAFAQWFEEHEQRLSGGAP